MTRSLKFYSVAELLKYNKENKIAKVKNITKIHKILKGLTPKFDELQRKYYFLEDLKEVQKIQGYRLPNQKYKLIEICKILSTSRETLYTKMSFNLKLRHMVYRKDNYDFLDQIEESFKIKRKSINN